MTVPVTVLRCKLCGYEWQPRMVDTPKACPRCKRYDWNRDVPKIAKTDGHGQRETASVGGNGQSATKGDSVPPAASQQE